MADLTMPRLSDSMEEGTIVRWLRSDGDLIRRGDEVVEIETDKATMTYEADGDGVLSIVAADGETLAVGDVIARLLADGEVAQPIAPSSTKGASDAAAPPAPTAAADTAPPAPALAPPAPAGDRVKASPIARRMATDAGLDLDGLTGSGAGGRIVKADVTAAMATRAATNLADGVSLPASPAPAAASASTGAKGEVSLQELTRLQQVLARRMAEAKATVPEFTVEVDIDMEEAVALLAKLKELAGVGGRAPSINDVVVRACGVALRERPRANGAFADGQFQLYSRVNVGIAVAAPDALVVPTLFDADRKSLGAIARESAELAGRVRDGSITPAELAGGTFTVSNLGMYGTTSFTAVINQPQAAILAVGAVTPRAVVHDGAVCARQTMTATLTCDHRILYGADAAALLARIRDLLEAPLSLTL